MVAGVIDLLFRDLPGGIYHIRGESACSRYDFAREAFRILGIKKEIRKVRLADFPRKAKIAHYSYMANSKLPAARSWQAMLKDYLTSK
jgi:dTDP-4-dehydrorhamnose reductase